MARGKQEIENRERGMSTEEKCWRCSDKLKAGTAKRKTALPGLPEFLLFPISVFLFPCAEVA
jgi:hypothetical protein